MPIDALFHRNALMRRIRAFFYEQRFTEVETPIRISAPCMELHIDAEPSGDAYLRTSPELAHKRLLAKGMERIFEIGKCFRQKETGRFHHPEYTMLEWYQAHADYMDMLEQTRALLSAVWKSAPKEWTVLSVAEAFELYAGWNPVEQFDADRFDLDLVEKIEPVLKEMGGAVVLKDYPAELAALARLQPENPRVAERWELYLNGLEIANAYSELTDAREQAQRFKQCALQRKKLGKEVYPLDVQFLDALRKMPEAGGVALGIDRLMMCMLHAKTIDEVLPF